MSGLDRVVVHRHMLGEPAPFVGRGAHGAARLVELLAELRRRQEPLGFALGVSKFDFFSVLAVPNFPRHALVVGLFPGVQGAGAVGLGQEGAPEQQVRQVIASTEDPEPSGAWRLGRIHVDGLAHRGGRRGPACPLHCLDALAVDPVGAFLRPRWQRRQQDQSRNGGNRDAGGCDSDQHGYLGTGAGSATGSAGGAVAGSRSLKYSSVVIGVKRCTGNADAPSDRTDSCTVRRSSAGGGPASTTL